MHRKICETILMNFREGKVKRNGVEIMYRDYGLKESKPILMVHGLGAVSYTHLTLPTKA